MKKSYKIAYIELECHSEVVSDFMSLMKYADKFEIDYFLSQTVLDELNTSQTQRFKICNFKNILSFLKDDYHLVIIGTASEHFKTYLKITEKFNTALIVHNLNFVKKSYRQILNELIKTDIKQFFRLLKQQIFYKDKLHHSAKLLVLSQHLVDENKDIHLHFFPITFNVENIILRNRNPIKVVIPGTVNNQRRDYNHVFKSIQKFTSSIQIFLLGKTDASLISQIENIRGHLNKNVELIYFKEYIDKYVFEKIMQEAHIIWSPIKKQTFFKSVIELYGQTKITGNINDAIRFGKPIIIPKHYNAQEENFIFFEQKNIEQQILEIASSSFDFGNYNKSNVFEALEKQIFFLITD